MASLVDIIAAQELTCSGEEAALQTALENVITLLTLRGQLVHELNDLGPYLAGVVGTNLNTWIQTARKAGHAAFEAQD